MSWSVRGREDSRLLRSRAERDGNVQDRTAVLRFQGRVHRGRAFGRVGQELDQNQREQRAAPAAAVNDVNDYYGRAVVRRRAAGGQQTVSRRVRQRAVRPVLRRRGRRRVLSRRGQQLLRDGARGRGFGTTAATAAAAAAVPTAVGGVQTDARPNDHTGRAAVAQVPGLLSAQPDGRVLRTAVGARVVHVHVQTRLGVLRQHQGGRAARVALAKAQTPAARAHHHHHNHATPAAGRSTRVPGIVHRTLLVLYVFQ